MYKYDITYWDEDTHEDIRDQGITYLSVDETELNEIPLMSKFCSAVRRILWRY